MSWNQNKAKRKLRYWLSVCGEVSFGIFLIVIGLLWFKLLAVVGLAIIAYPIAESTKRWPKTGKKRWTIKHLSHKTRKRLRFAVKALLIVSPVIAILLTVAGFIACELGFYDPPEWVSIMGIMVALPLILLGELFILLWFISILISKPE